mmetsp:Transcript_7526/g.19762  ORF Transcript_7526/g.19762 Transcript_7526/m.19762 type:complete len:425 (+) Transcript_7526:670-1944(+)
MRTAPDGKRVVARRARVARVVGVAVRLECVAVIRIAGDLQHVRRAGLERLGGPDVLEVLAAAGAPADFLARVVPVADETHRAGVRRGRSEAGVRLVVDDVVEVNIGVVVGAARREVVVGRLGGRDQIEVVGRVVAREPVRHIGCGVVFSLTAREIVDEYAVADPIGALAAGGPLRVHGVDHPVGARLVADVRVVVGFPTIRARGVAAVPRVNRLLPAIAEGRRRRAVLRIARRAQVGHRRGVPRRAAAVARRAFHLPVFGKLVLDAARRHGRGHGRRLGRRDGCRVVRERRLGRRGRRRDAGRLRERRLRRRRRCRHGRRDERRFARRLERGRRPRRRHGRRRLCRGFRRRRRRRRRHRGRRRRRHVCGRRRLGRRHGRRKDRRQGRRKDRRHGRVLEPARAAPPPLGPPRLRPAAGGVLLPPR